MNSELFIIFLLLGINLISNIVNTEWLFESYENFKFITIKTIVIRLVQFVLIFKLVNDLEDYWIYLLLLVLTTFVNNFVSFIVIKRKISFVWQHLQPKKYLKPLIIIFLLQNSNLLYTQIDRTILGDFIGMESVAFYTVAQKLVTFLYTVLMAITYVSIPRLSFYLSNDYGKYKDGVSKLSRTLFCFILPSSVGLFLLSEEAILVYAGDQYANSIVVLQVFSVRMIFMAIENIYANQILFLHKKENFTVIVYFIIGSINLIVKILLVQVLTPVIAISTTFLLEILLIIILKIYINKRIKARFQIFSMHSLKYFILSLCFFPLIEFCRKTLGFENIVSIICTVCVCILFYIGSLILLKDELVYSTFLKLKKNIGFN
jgi:O-antigen/teichoic acid export membrane protein